MKIERAIHNAVVNKREIWLAPDKASAPKTIMTHAKRITNVSNGIILTNGEGRISFFIMNLNLSFTYLKFMQRTQLFTLFERERAFFSLNLLRF